MGITNSLSKMESESINVEIYGKKIQYRASLVVSWKALDEHELCTKSSCLRALNNFT